MSTHSENLRYLRAKRGFSQQKVADDLLITRARYSKYEDGVSDPPLPLLRQIALYYHVSIDLLLGVDLRRVPMEELVKLEGNRILLPITVDKQGENHIEIIPHKAKAGYMTGYADPEFIESLEHISLPFLKSDQKYRAFPIEGDSMPPHTDGSFIIGRLLEDRREIKNGKTYVLLTINEGIVYKRVQKKGEETLTLISDNEFYEPYDIRHSDVIEVWEFACSISLIETDTESFCNQRIKQLLISIMNEIANVIP